MNRLCWVISMLVLGCTAKQGSVDDFGDSSTSAALTGSSAGISTEESTSGSAGEVTDAGTHGDETGGEGECSPYASSSPHGVFRSLRDGGTPFGQGPSPECQMDSECGDGSWLVEALGRPACPPPPLTFSECRALALNDPCMPETMNEPRPTCFCLDEQDGWAREVSDQGPRCFVYGRIWNCLYGPEDFPGCDLDAPATSCESVCADIQARRVAEAGMTYDAVARGTYCRNEACLTVYEIAGKCTVNGGAPAFDCSLSDAEILDAYAMAPHGCGG